MYKKSGFLSHLIIIMIIMIYSKIISLAKPVWIVFKVIFVIKGCTQLWDYKTIYDIFYILLKKTLKLVLMDNNITKIHNTFFQFFKLQRIPKIYVIVIANHIISIQRRDPVNNKWNACVYQSLTLISHI